MDESTERSMDRALKYGSAFSMVGSPTYHLDVDMTPFQLMPLALPVFRVAKVTFEVRVHYWRIRSRDNS
jgi:hypothetical protein